MDRRWLTYILALKFVIKGTASLDERKDNSIRAWPAWEFWGHNQYLTENNMAQVYRPVSVYLRAIVDLYRADLLRRCLQLFIFQNAVNECHILLVFILLFVLSQKT